MTPAGENAIRGVALTSTRGLFGRGPARTGAARTRASRGTTAAGNRITHPPGLEPPLGLGPLWDAKRCKGRARSPTRDVEHNGGGGSGFRAGQGPGDIGIPRRAREGAPGGTGGRAAGFETGLRSSNATPPVASAASLTLPGQPVSVTRMSSPPSEVRLTLEPVRRFEAIDVTRRVAAEAGDLLTRHGRA